MLTVAGVDAATWAIINPHIDKLPYWKHLKENYNTETLYCDVVPPLTPPVWTTVFTGKLPEEHGVRCFVRLDEKGYKTKQLCTKEDIRVPLIWEEVENSVALSVYCTFPPLNYNTKFNQHIANAVALEEEEFRQNIDLQSLYLAKHLEDKPDLLVFVNKVVDHVQHKYEDSSFEETINDVIKWYNITADRLLKQVVDLSDDWIIMSDHGLNDSGMHITPHAFVPTHKPDGLIISNLPNPPTKMTEVYQFIKENIR